MSLETMRFEDVDVGFTYRTIARTITEADLVNFSGVSGDFSELHLNAAKMKASPFGERIAHGALILSIATGLRGQAGLFGESLIAFAEIRSWRFAAPVFIGDTIDVRNEIVERRVTSKGDRGIVVMQVDVINQRNEIVQGGEMVSMVEVAQ